jgi:hypothetical protein
LQVECKEDLCWAAFEDLLLQGVATINPEVMIIVVGAGGRVLY